MATIEDEREGIAEALRVIPDTNIYPHWPRVIDTPCFLIRPVRRVYDEFNNPYRVYEIDVLSVMGDNEEAQMELDKYLEEEGEFSVIEALELNPTLGGVAGNIYVEGWSDYDGKRTETVPYVGATVTVHVYPARA